MVVGLLLLQFLVRTHNITLQDPYIDEGFHVVRAAHIWDFAEHPGRFSHGKVLVYFWMGAFRLTPETALHVSRTSLALFSLITGAALYAVARRLYDHTTGVLALALYALLPLAYFYERMAMADPLAAGFAALVAWRSLIFVRRPTLREGAGIGALLALALLAKLTMGLLPLLPVMAVVIFRARDGVEPRKLRAYLLPLIVAAGVMALIWAPMLIPARIAQINGDPFLLVDAFNLRGSHPEPATPGEYVDKWLPLIIDVTGRGFLVVCVVAWIVQVLPVQSWRTRSGAWYVFAWLALIALLPVVAARLITLRYFLAASGPGRVTDPPLQKQFTGCPRLCPYSCLVESDRSLSPRVGEEVDPPRPAGADRGLAGHVCAAVPVDRVARPAGPVAAQHELHRVHQRFSLGG